MLDIDRRLKLVLQGDRFRLRRRWLQIQKLASDNPRRLLDLERWELAFDESAKRLRERMDLAPQLTYDPELPITTYRETILQTLRERQTLVVCGETGSGKSTQLPKLCLEAGRGRLGMIGHTQPRRLAARSIANRLAEELDSEVGGLVGFKIRFTDKTNPKTLVKLMTDGVLLAEIQRDRFLDAYDTIIIDEAHERSLNIDLLMAYLNRLLDRRPDLKLIITSATIDAERFSHHFADNLGPAPILSVEGRTYPVEIRYRGPHDLTDLQEENHWLDRISDAVDELLLEGSGDILVFLASERDIRDAAKQLRGHLTSIGEHNRTEILPLYSRLTEPEQQKVFRPHSKRRIVLATNVAESSLTVPGIRYVIDAGDARISRYAPRSKVQRLPIEPIAQASADQRAGRCGRLGPGICIRLYSEADYAGRSRFTTPEIRRTNLASAILQSRLLGVGHLEDLPLLDPPRPEVIRDGIATLRELRAIDEHENLTPIGTKLGRWPVDPRVGRMLLEAIDRNCLADVLVIASGLEVQDPRLRPPEQQAAADQAHAKFNDPQSDFITLLRIWDAYHRWKEDLGRSRLEKACRENFLSLPRLREWADVHRQLLELVQEDRRTLNASQPSNYQPSNSQPGNSQPGPSQTNAPSKNKALHRILKTTLLDPLEKVHPNHSSGRRNQPADPPPRASFSREYQDIHTSLLAGLLSGIGMLDEDRKYQGPSQIEFQIWPGSAVKHLKPRWLIAAEIVETHQRYARCVAAIDIAWVEPLAKHLLKSIYEQPHFSRKHGSAMVYRRATLFGLPIVPRQQVTLAPVDPDLARRLLIDEGLAEGQLQTRAKFFQRNQQELNEVADWAKRTRKREWVVDPYRLQQHYEQHLPKEVVDRVSLEQWDRTIPKEHPIHFQWQTLVNEIESPPQANDFPDQLQLGTASFPLHYHFEPGSEKDGVRLQVPQQVVSQLHDARLQWGVPGLLDEKILGLIKTLPKNLRRNLVPAPDTAQRVASELRHEANYDRHFWQVLCQKLTSLAGETIQPADFQLDKLPQHLQVLIEVLDDQGTVIEASRDLATLQKKVQQAVGHVAKQAAPAQANASWARQAMTTFDIEELPVRVQVTQSGLQVEFFPALTVENDQVSTCLLDRHDAAEASIRRASIALFSQIERRELRSQVQHLPRYAEAQLRLASRFGAERMRDAIIDLLARLAFVDGEAPLRTRIDFNTRRTNRMHRIGMAVQDVARWLPKLADNYHAVALLLEKGPSTWNPNLESIRRQLRELFAPDCLLNVPWEWLKEYPRYMQAIASRLERLKTIGPTKDASLDQSVAVYWKMYESKLALLTPPRHDPRLVELRWMIEEFRVSVFAQQLGTKIPISAKRLDKWIDDLRSP